MARAPSSSCGGLCVALAISWLCLAQLASCAIISGLHENGVHTHIGFLQRSDFRDVIDKEAVELYNNFKSAYHAGNARLDVIEAMISKGFQALPKNEYGRLEPKATRHLVHSYFAKEHGWLLSGLEPHGHSDQVSEMHEIIILAEQAPSLARVLEDTIKSGHGFSLHDAAALTATLERLVLDRSVDLLVTAYWLNGESTADRLDEQRLSEVLSSFLVLFEFFEDAKPTNPKEHQDFKALAMETGKNWDHLVEFLRDTVFNMAFTQRDSTNPFVAKKFSYEEVTSFVDELTLRYGQWQDAECHLMTDFLEERATAGLVPLQDFYSVKLADMEYEFSESLGYLEEVGALDKESNSVRIANYIAGPSNCIAASQYFSICCISECQGIQNNIEALIQGPTAEPETLLAVVSNLSSRLVDAPRVLQTSLVDKLNYVADRHGGLVPLHSRLFAQWLFFAFPNECPFPHIVHDKNVLTSSYWLDRKSAEMFAEPNFEPENKSRTAPQWDEEEVLPLVEPPKKVSNKTRPADFARWLLLLAPIALFSRISWDMLRSAIDAARARRDNAAWKKAMAPAVPAAAPAAAPTVSTVAGIVRTKGGGFSV